ncbi:MAG: trimeric intracellular cation channel family protein [Nitratireductor sp.]|nr:trimeric intracellular cation channel family protein [Nitratireductor sp.]
MELLQFLDYAGVAVFAATGALAASRKQLDIIGFLFLASLTGVGGGTFRDMILGTTPVFWVQNSLYLAVCVVTAVIVYFAAPLIEFRYRLLLWLDAIGLSAYCVMGAAKGLAVGAPPLAAIVTGMMTATFGGILRDVVSGEPSVLLRREIYVTAALAGASAYVGLAAAGTPLALSVPVSVACAFLIRGGALHFGWTMPGYRHRSGRPPDDALPGREPGQ